MTATAAIKWHCTVKGGGGVTGRGESDGVSEITSGGGLTIG